MGFEKIYPAGELSAWETWRILVTKVMLKLSQDKEIRMRWRSCFREIQLGFIDLLDAPY